MKNIALIILAFLLIFVLCASLGGNAYQYYLSTQAQGQIHSLQNDLSKTSSDLTTTRSNLNTTNAKVSTLAEQIKQAEEKYNDLSQLQSNTQTELDEKETVLESMYCSTRIPVFDVKYATTNQVLLDPIAAAIRNYSDKTPIDTNYTVIWNNSKDANFTIEMSNNITYEVTVSWSWSADKHVRAIYNISGGCFFYFDHNY
jgi:TolA-binding protein